MQGDVEGSKVRKKAVDLGVREEKGWQRKKQNENTLSTHGRSLGRVRVAGSWENVQGINSRGWYQNILRVGMGKMDRGQRKGFFQNELKTHTGDKKKG